MTEDDFRTYIAAFNARDFAGFSKYYADDVEFNLGDAVLFHIKARDP